MRAPFTAATIITTIIATTIALQLFAPTPLSADANAGEGSSSSGWGYSLSLSQRSSRFVSALEEREQLDALLTSYAGAFHPGIYDYRHPGEPFRARHLLLDAALKRQISEKLRLGLGLHYERSHNQPQSSEILIGRRHVTDPITFDSGMMVGLSTRQTESSRQRLLLPIELNLSELTSIAPERSELRLKLGYLRQTERLERGERGRYHGGTIGTGNFGGYKRSLDLSAVGPFFDIELALQPHRYLRLFTGYERFQSGELEAGSLHTRINLTSLDNLEVQPMIELIGSRFLYRLQSNSFRIGAEIPLYFLSRSASRADTAQPPYLRIALSEWRGEHRIREMRKGKSLIYRDQNQSTQLLRENDLIFHRELYQNAPRQIRREITIGVHYDSLSW